MAANIVVLGQWRYSKFKIQIQIQIQIQNIYLGTWLPIEKNTFKEM